MDILSNKINEFFNPTTNFAKQTYNWDYIFSYLLQNNRGQEGIIYSINPVG